MSEEEKPDFSFLNELKNSSDSAILEKGESKPETESEKGEAEAEKPTESSAPDPADSQPAWMDEPETLEDRYDSSIRFAAALGSEEDQESKTDSLLNFSDDQETTQSSDEESVKQDEAVSQDTTENTSKSENLKPEIESEKSEIETEKPADPQPAWMEEPETLEDQESKTESPVNITDEQVTAQDEETSKQPSDDESVLEEPEDSQVGTVILSRPKEVETPADSDEQVANETNESSEEENETSEFSPSAESSEFDSVETSEFGTDQISESTEETTTSETVESSELAEEATETTETEETPASETAAAVVTTATITNPIKGPTVSKRKFMIVLSYASAVTLVCAILIMQSFQAKPHDLESLPDLKPPMKDDEIAYRLVPEAAGLPRGHTLKIGESRRFGNVLITPTKVVYEPIHFTHYSQDPTKTRAASKSAMKLWLKFENVSKDQKFAPLDRKIMLTRIVDPKRLEFMRSNQFLSPASQKGNLEKTSLLYDLEMVGDWNFAESEDDPLVSPGESIEIYLPSTEDAFDEMDGKIVWRVQFRKGYHPKSKRGVTTLIEVVFDKKDVVST